MSESYELVTVYVGKNATTYLLSEYLEFGEGADPIRKIENLSETIFFTKSTSLEDE